MDQADAMALPSHTAPTRPPSHRLTSSAALQQAVAANLSATRERNARSFTATATGTAMIKIEHVTTRVDCATRAAADPTASHGNADQTRKGVTALRYS